MNPVERNWARFVDVVLAGILCSRFLNSGAFSYKEIRLESTVTYVRFVRLTCCKLLTLYCQR